MPLSVRTELGKWTPQRIRKKLLGDADADGLVILDEKHQTAGVDLEDGYALAVPTGATVSGSVLTPRQRRLRCLRRRRPRPRDDQDRAMAGRGPRRTAAAL
jgi:hypothetical protein